MAKKKRQSDPHDGSDSSTESGNDKSHGSGSLLGNCQHIKRAVDLSTLRKALKTPKFNAEKCNECAMPGTPASPQVEQLDNGDDYEYDQSLWVCLKCGASNCGRTVNKHALKHYEVSQVFVFAVSFFICRYILI